MKYFHFYLFLLMAMMLFSCNYEKSRESTSAVDSTVVVKRDSDGNGVADSGTATHEAEIDSIDVSGNLERPARRDTLKFEKPETNQPKSVRKAIFGYSFFKNMREHETRSVNAYVSIINAVSKVIDTLKELNATDIPVRKNDTATVLTRNMAVFKAVTVSLVNAGDSDFIIKPFAEAHQLIDSLGGNSWTWSVTPRTGKSYGSLVMNVIAERPDGTREPFSAINIPITISLDKGIIRTIWQWMMDNPEKVLTIILIPLIIFFWKQIVGLFKKETPETKD